MPERSAQCDSMQDVFDHRIIRCEREHGHGGAHTATIDDPATDPYYKYVVSWWPREFNPDAEAAT